MKKALLVLLISLLGCATTVKPPAKIEPAFANIPATPYFEPLIVKDVKAHTTKGEPFAAESGFLYHRTDHDHIQIGLSLTSAYAKSLETCNTVLAECEKSSFLNSFTGWLTIGLVGVVLGAGTTVAFVLAK